MIMITTIIEDQAFQVKAEKFETSVVIQVLSLDQQIILYSERIYFTIEKIALDYVTEFTKREAKIIVKRYIKYKQ